MAHQTHIVWLLLLLTGVKSLIVLQINYHFETLKSDYYVTSSDLLRQQKILFASINTTTGSWLYTTLEVTLAESHSAYKKCDLKLFTSKNTESIGLNSLKRFKGDQVLLETYEQIKNGNRYTTLIFLDMKSCIVTFPLPLQLSGKTFVHRRRNDQFDVFSADKFICKSTSGTCRIKYYGSYHSIEPFQVDLDWSSLRIERTFNDNVFLMCGLSGGGKYQVELHDFRNNSVHKELVSLSDIENMQIITSDLAVCWIIDTKKENTIVHCSQFDQKGALIFRSTITYVQKVKLIFLYSVRPGKIVLITASKETSSWRVFVTMAERDRSPKSADDQEFIFACVDNMVFAARTIDNMIEIENLCHDEGFHYTTLYIVDQ